MNGYGYLPTYIVPSGREAGARRSRDFASVLDGDALVERGHMDEPDAALVEGYLDTNLLPN